MAKRAQSIPLDAIPDKKKKRMHTEAFKRRAVEALSDPAHTVETVAEEFKVSTSMVRYWQKRIDPLADVRLTLNRAQRERQQRLESAAMLVEADGTPLARQLGARIRAMVGTMYNGAAVSLKKR